ncbi:hypothetical protein DH2020_021879 [Rehmannia glutinosa]|uniref:DUF4283 domain-containing protein n=1 Tax=Rehmannia glutinosa TaxID=99300 RepID=A0ABR0WDA8_REHGL
MANSGSFPPEGHVTSDNPIPPKSYANVTGVSSSSHVQLSFNPKDVVPFGNSRKEDGQKGPYSWSFANSSHIIIKLQIEEDYNKLWMGTLWSLGDCPMRVFKWTLAFDPCLEAPIAPVWIRLPGLPIHIFNYHALYAICKEVGNPLQVDSPTARRTRLSMARACVEIDLLKERVEEIVLEFAEVRHVQKIIYERVPDYCLHCKHIGHNVDACYMNGNKIRPPQR